MIVLLEWKLNNWPKKGGVYTIGNERTWVTASPILSAPIPTKYWANVCKQYWLTARGGTVFFFWCTFTLSNVQGYAGSGCSYSGVQGLVIVGCPKPNQPLFNPLFGTVPFQTCRFMLHNNCIHIWCIQCPVTLFLLVIKATNRFENFLC